MAILENKLVDKDIESGLKGSVSVPTDLNNGHANGNGIHNNGGYHNSQGTYIAFLQERLAFELAGLQRMQYWGKLKPLLSQGARSRLAMASQARDDGERIVIFLFVQ